MQPFIAITSGADCLIYVNGRLAGEAPVVAPVAPEGTCYIEARYFGAGLLPGAHRLAFRGGRLESARGAACVKWPCGVCEIELTAERARREESEYFVIDGAPCAILRGEDTLLRYAGATLSVPEGALPPEKHTGCEDVLLIGRSSEGMYACCFARDGRALGACEGDIVDIESGGAVRCITRLGDVTGHARVETWAAEHGRFEMAYSEYAWADGAPKAPRSPEETARAAVEAALLGIGGEADSFLAPNLRGKGYMREFTRDAISCVSMKFAPPSAENAVGLVFAEADDIVNVKPLIYRASPSGGAAGWVIEGFKKAE